MESGMDQWEARAIAIDVAKAALWEEAKGKLRACVSVAGQCYEARMPTHSERFTALQAAVEAFIEKVEGEVWHE